TYIVQTPDIDQKLDHREIKDITDTVAGDFVSGEVDEVSLLYSQYVTPAVCRQVVIPLLPIRALTEVEREGPAADFIYEPSPEAILEILFPKYLHTRVVASLAESFASE
ncbi:unnamed protein product, partial [marine sediment metagenome]